MSTKKTILVVDDNAGIVASLTMVLEYGGYEVMPALSAEEVKKMRAPFPDLILLDIWMTGINGLDVCAHLKALEDTKHIPIIMISAYPNSGVQAFEAGANDFLEKPYSMDAMLSIVGKHLVAE